MKYSTKSRYALRLMEDLAHYPLDEYVSLKEVSAHQNISLKYLEQIVTPLTRAGLLKSVRGSQGGYRLVKTPAEYTTAEIIQAIEGSIATIPCLENEINTCPRHAECRTLAFWEGLDTVIRDYLERTTLEDLVQQDNGGNFYNI